MRHTALHSMLVWVFGSKKIIMGIRFELILVFFLISGGISSFAQDIDFSPKSLDKDLKKLWDTDAIALSEIAIPDSLYHDILLDKGKIFSASGNGEDIGFAYVGRIFSCRAGGCGNDQAVASVPKSDDYEYFDYFIIFDQNLVVQKIRVYNYQATHGHEVGGKGWLKQFVGYQGEEKLEYGKNIDSISGATISANAITYNVQESCRYLSLIKSFLNNSTERLKVIMNN